MYFSPSFRLSKQIFFQRGDDWKTATTFSSTTRLLCIYSLRQCFTVMWSWKMQSNRGPFVSTDSFLHILLSPRRTFFSVLFRSSGARLQWLERLSRHKLLISLCPPNWLLISRLAGKAELNELSILGDKWSLNFVSYVLKSHQELRLHIPQHWVIWIQAKDCVLSLSH